VPEGEGVNATACSGYAWTQELIEAVTECEVGEALGEAYASHGMISVGILSWGMPIWLCLIYLYLL